MMYRVFVGKNEIGATLLNQSNQLQGGLIGAVNVSHTDFNYAWLKEFCITNTIELIHDNPENKELTCHYSNKFKLVDEENNELSGEGIQFNLWGNELPEVHIIGIKDSFFEEKNENSIYGSTPYIYNNQVLRIPIFVDPTSSYLIKKKPFVKFLTYFIPMVFGSYFIGKANYWDIQQIMGFTGIMTAIALLIVLGEDVFFPMYRKRVARKALDFLEVSGFTFKQAFYEGKWNKYRTVIVYFRDKKSQYPKVFIRMYHREIKSIPPSFEKELNFTDTSSTTHMFEISRMDKLEEELEEQLNLMTAKLEELKIYSS